MQMVCPAPHSAACANRGSRTSRSNRSSNSNELVLSKEVNAMKLRFNDAAAIAICSLVVLFAEAADTTSPITGSWRLNNWTSHFDTVHLELSRRTLTSHWIDRKSTRLNSSHIPL